MSTRTELYAQEVQKLSELVQANQGAEMITMPERHLRERQAELEALQQGRHFSQLPPVRWDGCKRIIKFMDQEPE